MPADTGARQTYPDWRVARLARLVESDRFNTGVAVVIVGYAFVLGAQTYDTWTPAQSNVLGALDLVFYLLFVVELLLRIASYGRKPWMFFTDGWNVFDFVVIAGVLIPGVREKVAIVRLLRLARIVRIVRVLPEARMLLRTIARALPAVATMFLVTIVVLFLYAMVGWALFGDELRNDWGNIGSAMLTMFVLLTLENFPTYLNDAATVTPWAYLYFLSYVLVAAFVIVNLFIGIVVGAMEEARLAPDDDDDDHPTPPSMAEVTAQISALQRTLDAYVAAEQDRPGPEHS